MKLTPELMTGLAAVAEKHMLGFESAMKSEQGRGHKWITAQNTDGKPIRVLEIVPTPHQAKAESR